MIILAIEDNKTDRKILEKAIKHAEATKQIVGKIKIDFVDNVSGATKLLTENRYDLIITDLRLPDSEGLETIQKIRAITKKPILIISGSYEKRILEIALQEGAAKYIRKGENWTTTIASTIRAVIKDAFFRERIGEILNCAI